MKKSQADKALASLAGQGQIVCKEFGKTKIYFATQEDRVSLSEEEMKEKVSRIEALKKDVGGMAEAVGALQQEYRKLKSSKTLGEMEDEYAALQREAEELDGKLAVLRNGEVKQISPAEIKGVEKSIESCLTAWKSRKRVFKNVWDTVSENLNGNQKDLFESIGIEEDEEDVAVLEKSVKAFSKKRGRA